MVTARTKLSRRERQAMDIIYARGRASASDVRAAMFDAPTDAAVRTTLRILVAKGHLKIEQDGPRYLYSPVVSRTAARKSALRHLLSTFFDGSTESALTALLDVHGNLDDDVRKRLKQLIDKAAKEGR
jgi:predicted transcriptional regulator